MSNSKIKCPKNSKININDIKFFNYGSCDANNMKNKVQNLCDQKEECSIEKIHENELMKDCPGFDMSLQYSCVDDIGKGLTGSGNISMSFNSHGDFSDAIHKSKMSQMDRMMYKAGENIDDRMQRLYEDVGDLDEIQNLSNYSSYSSTPSQLNQNSYISENNLVINQEEGTIDSESSNFSNLGEFQELEELEEGEDSSSSSSSSSSEEGEEEVQEEVPSIYDIIDNYWKKNRSNIFLLMIIMVGLGIIFLAYRLTEDSIRFR